MIFSSMLSNIRKNPLGSTIHHTVFSYPGPINTNYFWNFGFLAIVTLLVQIVTGILLAMHYVPSAHEAFGSVEHIMREVNYGWLLRYCHANGASMFFIVIYFHIFRGLYYGSFIYPRVLLWNIGVVLLLLMIITGFLGYVLPWGQMSYWAATVITNLASVIPFFGNMILYWLWGGFSVSNATLNKFFSLHFLFPFLIILFTVLHIIVLHLNGSNNPLGFDSFETLVFTPYFTIKDLLSLIIYFFVFSTLVFFMPNLVNHSDNYIMANPLSTPTHIVPEWYLLAFYAILRSIPHKLMGVIALLLAILILMLLPILIRMPVRSAKFRPFYKFYFWFFVLDCFLLSFIGGNAAEEPFIFIGQLATAFYFLFFIFFFPLICIFDLLYLELIQLDTDLSRNYVLKEWNENWRVIHLSPKHHISKKKLRRKKKSVSF